MKIALLNDFYPPATQDSVARITQKAAQVHRAKGHDVLVVTTHRGKDVKHEDGVVFLPASYRLSLRHWRSLYSPRMSRLLRQVLEDFQPDKIHAHNIHTYLTYDALRIARKYTEDVTMTLHDCMSFCYGRLNTKAYLDHGITVPRLRDHLRMAGLQYNPLRNRFIRHHLNTHPQKLYALSKEHERALRENGIRNTEVRYNTTDMKPQDPTPLIQKYDLQDKKVLFFPGRNNDDKGAQIVVDLLSSLDEDVLLLVTGDEDQWNQRCTDDLHRRLICMGRLTEEEMMQAYAAADVVLNPSIYLDAFNLCNLEAMTAGTPVVTTIFGGPPEVVGDKGKCVDPRDSEALREAVVSYL